MNRASAVVAMLAVAATGCSSPAATKLAVAGTLAAAAGVGLVFGSESFECELCLEQLSLVGSGIVLGIGGAIMLGGAVIIEAAHAASQDEEPPPPPTFPMAASSATPIVGDETTPRDRSASTQQTVREPLPAMPEMQDRSKPQNRLAIQASMIARTGNCSGARATGQQLRRQDPALYDRLVAADATFAACTRQ